MECGRANVGGKMRGNQTIMRLRDILYCIALQLHCLIAAALFLFVCIDSVHWVFRYVAFIPALFCVKYLIMKVALPSSSKPHKRIGEVRISIKVLMAMLFDAGYLVLQYCIVCLFIKKWCETSVVIAVLFVLIPYLSFATYIAIYAVLCDKSQCGFIPRSAKKGIL